MAQSMKPALESVDRIGNALWQQVDAMRRTPAKRDVESDMMPVTAKKLFVDSGSDNMKEMSASC